jgi:hypothetical protein
VVEKKSYIWRVGILRFGLSMFVFMTLFSLFASRNLHPITVSRVLFSITVGLLIWPAAGALLGLIL